LRRSVEKNLLHTLSISNYPTNKKKQRIKEILKFAKLEHLAKQSARNLSIGQQQLISIMRALAIRPSFLFLDEPCANLDPKITQIIEINGPQELGLEGKKYTRISIFMDVLCCHVNRVPYTGTVADIFYKPGKYINATLDKASEDNERNYLKLKNSNGDELIVVQIAGMIARRIVCDVKVGDTIKQGDRFGIIRFGSKVDLYFENYQLLVCKNQNTVAGETLLAKRI